MFWTSQVISSGALETFDRSELQIWKKIAKYSISTINQTKIDRNGNILLLNQYQSDRNSTQLYHLRTSFSSLFSYSHFCFSCVASHFYVAVCKVYFSTSIKRLNVESQLKCKQLKCIQIR